MPYSPAQIAEAAHEANRVVQHHQADPGVPVAPVWADLDEETRDSVIAGVRGVLDGNDPEESHAGWCDFKRAHGWTYGPVKDQAAKTHPCLVDYDQLPQHQRDKDELFVAIVGALDDTPPEPLDLTGRHPGVRDRMRWLTPNPNPNLPSSAALVAGFHHSLAEMMVRNISDGPELTAGLRKVLEAKDCLVRALLADEGDKR